MNPVILITLHRRYHELELALENINRKKIFFKKKPKIVVIWADPENGRKWFIDSLLKNKLIDNILYRYKLPNEGNTKATTFYESQNIRLGLQNVFRLYENSYCIVQASDICITEYGLYLMENEMNNGAELVNFYWQNKFTLNAWSTNCFAVKSNQEYWPPFCDIDCLDTLEKLWFKSLENKTKLKITTMSNNNNIVFVHNHISEKLNPFPIKYIDLKNNLKMYIKGNMEFTKMIKNFLRCIFKGGNNV